MGLETATGLVSSVNPELTQAEPAQPERANLTCTPSAGVHGAGTPSDQESIMPFRSSIVTRTTSTSRHICISRNCTCLLYTSDAADDLLCVDLGGRRIIKKKKKKDKLMRRTNSTNFRTSTKTI
eukprot:TRINITY_DN2246_c0_g1_i3.p1 TRINITY_DN2246_c0_g1~~TRINITY_DN2246_c0_g1_i3.p1  ORF type:complete len:124 (-),score=9.36 TRINITY_DN2246_c0_g1_i3:18-389(-)